jgi:hexosaminidase
MRKRYFIKLVLLFIFSVFHSLSALSQQKDFRVKGFHIDLRSQVMTMPALKAFAKELADLKINTLVMEWEATFPYNENATISNKYAYKPQEVKDFIAYCTDLGIDVIPLHHCFGHVEWILRHDRYRQISEDKKEVSQVCPLKEEEAVTIFKSLFKELVSYHPSKYFHIGGDETYLLGSCDLCKAKVEKEGKSKLFVDYVKAMCEIVTDLGKTPVMWADIILKYPEAIKEMPENTIYVDWNYGWKINHFGDIQKLYDAGATLWGAPSLRSSPDNMYLTTWSTHFNNQKDYIPYARNARYEGIIMTSWSTSGLYSFMYDQGWEIQDMEQVRNVYPLNGFRILLAAYGKSVNQTAPLNPEEFVIEYSQTRFGMTEEEGKTLWTILSLKQEVLRNGKIIINSDISNILEETIHIRNRLYDLKPKRNKIEIDHLKLMFDIRVNYLCFKEIESAYQSDTYHRSQAKDLLSRLNVVIEKEKNLDKRFRSLQKNFLSQREIDHQNEIRKRKMIVTRDFLTTNI